MSNGAPGATAAIAVARARRAAGSIVKLDALNFAAILAHSTKPLVVTARDWLFGTRYRYLTSYRGLTFYTWSRTELLLPNDAEIVEAGSMWVP